MLDGIHAAHGMLMTYWESEAETPRQEENGTPTEILSRFVELMAGRPSVEGFEVVLQT